MAQTLYKIVSQSNWAHAKTAGALAGTPDDLADGYIHFSTASQLRSTLEKHYRGQSGLVLAGIDPALLPEGLKWEPARGGELFPHLYAALPLSAVVSERALEAEADGGFDLPEVAS